MHSTNCVVFCFCFLKISWLQPDRFTRPRIVYWSQSLDSPVCYESFLMLSYAQHDHRLYGRSLQYNSLVSIHDGAFSGLGNLQSLWVLLRIHWTCATSPAFQRKIPWRQPNYIGQKWLLDWNWVPGFTVLLWATWSYHYFNPICFRNLADNRIVSIADGGFSGLSRLSLLYIDEPILN